MKEVTFKQQLARIFCESCPIYVEQVQSCCYVDGSGRDKFCTAPLNKLDQLFALRSKEGYRLAIVDDNAELPEDVNLEWEIRDVNSPVTGNYSAYKNAEQDMIVDGYVKEVKEK